MRCTPVSIGLQYWVWLTFDEVEAPVWLWSGQGIRAMQRFVESASELEPFFLNKLTSCRADRRSDPTPMGWTPLRRHLVPRSWLSKPATRGEASMEEVSIIGLDLAKNVFQLHGARPDGSVAFRRTVSRSKLLSFFAAIPRCLVAMEACASAHHWARQIGALGHEVRLIAPIYVKPFVKRNKNDAADAEAIAEAASRPTMRFVAVKTVEKQAAGVAFRTRDLLVRQRTQTINAIRGHMAEYGWVAPKGPSWVAMLGELIDDEVGSSLLPAAREMFRVMLDMLGQLDRRIADLDQEIARRAREDE